jgi:hypothetical protein
VWQEALRELHTQRRSILGAAGVFLVAVLLINLFPRVPVWEAGFVTGVLSAFLISFVWWAAFVPSGLAMRSLGTLAERWTDETLHETPGVYAVIPSVKFAGRDVDHVVVAAAGVRAVESKWCTRRPDAAELLRYADQAAAVGRSLRLNLRRDGLGDDFFASAVLIWGPGGSGVGLQELDGGTGRVTVMGGHQAGVWLESLGRGRVGPDYAESLQREVHELAVQRDQRVEAGPVLRWLARAR